MPKQPRIKPKKLIKILQKTDFFIHHQTGSHIILKHKTKKYLRITVPYHNSELAPKTLKSILAQAEMSINDLIKKL